MLSDPRWKETVRGFLQRKSRLVLQHPALATFQLMFAVNTCRLAAKHRLFVVTVTLWLTFIGFKLKESPQHSGRWKDEFTS